MTDWGAHHFDIAQWGLGMDESGPVEIIPPEDPKAQKGVRYVYANGVEVIHGDEYEPGKKLNGVAFIGVGRQDLRQPRLPGQRPRRDHQAAARREGRPPLQVAGPPARLAGLPPLAQTAALRRRDRRPFGDGLPPRATWPTGTTRNCAGTRAVGSSSTTPKPTSGSTASAASRGNCRRSDPRRKWLCRKPRRSSGFLQSPLVTVWC